MTTVTVHHAKTHLSKLLAAVEAGEEIVIARGDKPVAKLSSVTEKPLPKRQPGALKGELTLTDEQNEALCAPLDDDIIDEWERRFDDRLGQLN